jgi:hypothetical protein
MAKARLIRVPPNEAEVPMVMYKPQVPKRRLLIVTYKPQIPRRRLLVRYLISTIVAAQTLEICQRYVCFNYIQNCYNILIYNIYR